MATSSKSCALPRAESARLAAIRRSRGVRDWAAVLVIAVLCCMGASTSAAANTRARMPRVLTDICPGCEGGAWFDSDAQDPGCPGAVIAISVVVSDGVCAGVFTEPGVISDCQTGIPCHVVINRSWSGLPADLELDFCVTANGVRRCIRPKPTSGSGSGSDTKEYDLTCTGVPITWDFVTPCGLSASVTGSCGECQQ